VTRIIAENPRVGATPPVACNGIRGSINLGIPIHARIEAH